MSGQFLKSPVKSMNSRFLARFDNIALLVDDVKKQGILPHIKNQSALIRKDCVPDFIRCFGSWSPYAIMSNNAQYTMREAAKKDIPALINVFQESVRHTAGRDYTSEQVEAWASRGTPARFLELFDSGLCFFMAELDYCCIGFASVSSQGFLHSLFIAPEYQRKGVATALLEKAIQSAKDKGAENITAEVSVTALPFFGKAGFAVTQEQEVYIGEIRLNNYLMRLTV